MQKQKQYKDLIRYLKTSKNESPSIIHVDKITDKHSAQHLSCVDFSPKPLSLSHNLGNHTQYRFWVETLTLTYVFLLQSKHPHQSSSNNRHRLYIKCNKTVSFCFLVVKFGNAFLYSKNESMIFLSHFIFLVFFFQYGNIDNRTILRARAL